MNATRPPLNSPDQAHLEHHPASALTFVTRTVHDRIAPTIPDGFVGSTKPPAHSASPAKRCCIRSNAVNSRLSTSTADAVKASHQRFQPPGGLLVNPHEGHVQCQSVPAPSRP